MSTLDRAGIEALLPHRDPFLMLDRVTELVPGERAVGEKDITDEMCKGHFPGHPVMPGVLITEAMAQLAAVIALSESPEAAGKPVYLLGTDKMRFRKMVKPGDVLQLEVLLTDRRRMLTFTGTARVDGARVATGSILAAAEK
jgi:3-hydroxyacyl-[acyl-carrier-protein] dehydratase